MANVECEPMVPDEDGWSEWIHPLPGYLMQCCDCGLIHEMEFSVERIVERLPGGRFHAETVTEPDIIVMFRARRAAPSPTETKDE